MLRLVAQFGLEAGQACHLLVDGMPQLLVDDLLRRRRADDAREIAAVRVVPVGAAGVVQAQPEQERFQAVLRGLEGDDGVLARPRQVAHRLVLDRGDVDRREVSGTQQPGEGDGVASIGLDAVSRFAWNEGRRDDQTGHPPAGQVPVQGVAAGPGLVGDDQAHGFVLEATDEPVDVDDPGADATDVGDLGASVVGNVRDRDGVLVDIETDEQRGVFLHG